MLDMANMRICRRWYKKVCVISLLKKRNKNTAHATEVIFKIKCKYIEDNAPLHFISDTFYI